MMPHAIKAILSLGSMSLILWACGQADDHRTSTDISANPVIETAKDAPNAPVFHASGKPKKLSDWGMFDIGKDRIMPRENVVPYTLNSALFSDYALKYRTIWLPETAAAGIVHDQYLDDNGKLVEDWIDFPVGTVITKTFFYQMADMDKINPPRPINVKELHPKDGVFNGTGQNLPPDHYFGISRLFYRNVETRLLVHRENGWEALPYIWDEDGMDATLSRTGGLKEFDLFDPHTKETTSYVYEIPNVNQCAGCHATNNTTREMRPIGVKPRHINITQSPYSYLPAREGDDLLQWAALYDAGIIDNAVTTTPPNAAWSLSQRFDINHRARSYLDINCSHCHNPVGPGDTSGLFLDPTTKMTSENFGFCKQPIAAGGGTGGRLYDIVPGFADQSILHYRMNTTDAGARMPELGRALTDKEAVVMIGNWIDQLDPAIICQ